MTALSRSRNPILWQENNYQRRNAPKLLRYANRIGPLVLILTIVGVVYTLQDFDYPSRELAIYIVWVTHAIVVVRALVAGAITISREHTGQTWDTLVLTGVSARQIFFGKWRAALDQTGPWMLAFGIFRLAMLPLFMITVMTRYAGWYMQYYANASGSSYSSYSSYEPVMEMSWVPWATYLAVFSTVALTLLETLACTAIGVAASAITRRGAIAAITAFTIRFIPVALFAIYTRTDLGDVHAYRYLRAAPIAIADAGTAPISRLMVPYMQWSLTTHIDALGGLLLSYVLLLALLLLGVTVAWLAIRASGALPQPSKPNQRGSLLGKLSNKVLDFARLSSERLKLYQFD